MKPLMLISLLVALGVGARAEIFTPPLASGHGFHRQTRSPVIEGRGHAYAGHRHSPFIGGYSRWHDRGGFFGARTGFYLGYNLFDDWYPWPTYEPVLSTYGPYQVSSPVIVSQPRVILAGDGLRDARSPEQLRAIFGAQAESLIPRN